MSPRRPRGGGCVRSSKPSDSADCFCVPWEDASGRGCGLSAAAEMHPLNLIRFAPAEGKRHVATSLSSDPLEVLLRHDHWGTRRVLEVCRELSAAQFQQRFDMGLGSLHEILTHVIGAMRRWADRLEQRPIRAAIDNPPRNAGLSSDYRVRTPDELIVLLDEAAQELVAVASRIRAPGGAGLASEIVFALDNTTYRTTRGAGLVHVTTHGSHHRAQCLNLLRRLGVTVLPELTVVDWQSEVETKAVEPFARRNVLPATRSQGKP